MRAAFDTSYLLSLANIKEDVLRPIYEIVGGNPLALRLIVGQTRVHSLSVILNNLATAVGERSEVLYTFIYRQAWNSLNPRSQGVFLAMLLASNRGSSRNFLLNVTDLNPADLDNALDHLVSLNLVDSAGNEIDRCYSIHHLTRTFLQSKIKPNKGEVANLDDYSLKFQEYLKRSIRHITKKLGQVGTALLLPDERDHALQILSDAFKNPEIWPDTRVLLLELAPRMEQAGYHDEWIPYLQQGVPLSQNAGDERTEAELRFYLGVLYELQGKYNEAWAQLEVAEKLFEKLSLFGNQAQALNRLAKVARRQRRFAEARSLVNKAFNLLDKDDTERGHSLLVLGAIALDRQEWLEAVEFFQQAYVLWKTENNQRMLAWSLNHLGIPLRRLGRHEEAIRTYEQAIALLDKLQDPVNRAVTQMNLGNVYLDLGQPDLALELFQSAEKIFRQTQEPLRLGKLYNNIALTYHQLHEWQKADDFFRLSIEHFNRTSNIPSLVNALDGLGMVYLNQDKCTEAKLIFEEALTHISSIASDPQRDYLSTVLVEHLQEVIKKDGHSRVENC